MQLQNSAYDLVKQFKNHPFELTNLKPSEFILGLLRIPMDFVMGLLAFYTAYEMRSLRTFIPGITLKLDVSTFPSLPDYLKFSTASIAVLILLFALSRMYSFKIRFGISRETARIAITSAAWLGLILGYYVFAIRQFPFSRLVLIYSWILTIILIICGRILIHLIENLLYRFNIGKKKVLFIGNNQITDKLAAKMVKNPRYTLVGLIDDHLKKSQYVQTLGKMDELNHIAKKYQVDHIIQTNFAASQLDSTDILNFCRENQLEYSFVPDLLAVQQTNVEIATLAGIPIIQLKPTPLDGWGRVIKRVFDLFGSIVGVILLSPIFLITAIAIKITSKGTILFKYLDDGSRVKRVGEHGKLFHFYKFRTMKPNSHNLRYTELAEKNLRQGSPLVKIKDDPRVTTVGKFLRKTDIDELPQLINVLKGEMSLVGPRPHLPEEVANYQKHHKFVLSIKPGITGLAQISGRSDLDFEEEIRLDTYYIEHWSIWLDIKIILKTVFVLFKGYEE